MGVTIHYTATFNKKKSLAKMVEEIKDIAEVNGWEYHIFETKFPKADTPPANNRYGIFVSPPRCETIDFTFGADGKMHGWVFTKTQFAGSAMHITVVNLLRYISNKYYSHIEVDDEGDYWQTGNAVILEKHISSIGLMLKTLAHTFNNTPRAKDQPLETYILQTVQKAKAAYEKKKPDK